jgi:hypothetical protein
MIRIRGLDGTSLLRLAVLAIAVHGAAASSPAGATTTVCSEKASKRYRYGEQASIRFEMPQVGPDGIADAVKAFAAENRLTYTTGGTEDPFKTPVFKSLTHILQSESADVAIRIRTTNRDNIATATISTFSVRCGATEDWRPYWREFQSFIETRRFAVIADR